MIYFIYDNFPAYFLVCLGIFGLFGELRGYISHEIVEIEPSFINSGIPGIVDNVHKNPGLHILELHWKLVLYFDHFD